MVGWGLHVGRAFSNMLGAAIRDPLWAFLCIVLSPFRSSRFLFQTLAILFLSAVVLIAMGVWVEHSLSPLGQDVLVNLALLVIIGLILSAVLLRLITRPLLDHFGDDGSADTHGSARFATRSEMKAFTGSADGLLIGRDDRGRLLRYDGPAHLLIMAPTRSGKGVGTIIPNLLMLNRSVICIDPKGENARITARARSGFGAVHILDPFGITGLPSAACNPLAKLDANSTDIAEDAALLAEALVYDDPGTTGDVHWNEEARALITGLILYIVASETGNRRCLASLRDWLTLDPDSFYDLLSRMQTTDACQGLIRRAANRHLSKSDREAAGVLSSAQRHTHFLDSPRMTQVLQRSDFDFADLKTETTTVFLVLPPDRLGTYARWLRLLITQSLTAMVRSGSSLSPQSHAPVLYLLDEFAALGHLAAVERAMGLLAGYGVQLWPILQDIHQLKATYGRTAGTFLSNAGVLQVFGLNDHESAKSLSDLLGQETVVFRTLSRNLDSDDSGLSHAQHHTGRPLLTPDEVRTLPEHLQLLFVSQHRPMAAQKLRYYHDREFRGLFDKG